MNMFSLFFRCLVCLMCQLNGAHPTFVTLNLISFCRAQCFLDKMEGGKNGEVLDTLLMDSIEVCVFCVDHNLWFVWLPMNEKTRIWSFAHSCSTCTCFRSFALLHCGAIEAHSRIALPPRHVDAERNWISCNSASRFSSSSLSFSFCVSLSERCALRKVIDVQLIEYNFSLFVGLFSFRSLLHFPVSTTVLLSNELRHAHTKRYWKWLCSSFYFIDWLWAERNSFTLLWPIWIRSEARGWVACHLLRGNVRWKVMRFLVWWGWSKTERWPKFVMGKKSEAI